MNIISVLLIRFVIFPALQNINVVAVNNSLRRRYTVYVDKRSEDCYFIKDVEYGLTVSFVVTYKLRRDIPCHCLKMVILDIPKLFFCMKHIFQVMNSDSSGRELDVWFSVKDPTRKFAYPSKSPSRGSYGGFSNKNSTVDIVPGDYQVCFSNR